MSLINWLFINYSNIVLLGRIFQMTLNTDVATIRIEKLGNGRIYCEMGFMGNLKFMTIYPIYEQLNNICTTKQNI